MPGFLSWARSAANSLGTQASPLKEDGLEALGRWIGPATLVAFGEGEHLAREPLEFRNQLFRYLVEHKGFTAIAIESGLLESRIVDRYVDGGPVDLELALADGIGWTFDRLPQNRDLIVWMRAYNQDPRHATKLHFFGFDISGSPGNTRAQVKPQVAAARALDYLQKVDPEAGRAFRRVLLPWITYLDYDFACPPASASFAALSTRQRQRLARVVLRLLHWFEAHQSSYVAKSSADDYEWAYRAAVAVQQLDEWLEVVPVSNAPCANPLAVLARTDEVRDRYQAQNLGWIRKREVARGGVLVFAHTLHLSRSGVYRCWGIGEGGKSDGSCAAWNDAGTHLSDRYGSELIVIASVLGSGSVGCGRDIHPIERPATGSLASLMAQVSRRGFMLDLRAAPPAAIDILKMRWQWGTTEQWQGAWQRFESVARPAFDVLIYFPTVAPACTQ